MSADAWNDAPASNGDAAWAADGSNEYTGGDFREENVSKHANGNFGEGGNGNGCRICHSESHFARDCPEKKPNTGECFRCGEHGHNKAECTNEPVQREFTGQCRLCNETGHRAAECPQKGPSTCKLCKQEGHIASECNANRLFVDVTIPEMSVDDAWNALMKADSEKDVEDIKTMTLAYAKAYPEVTLLEMEKVFRDSGMNTHLIAKEQEISDVHTIVNFQGVIDQKYVISFQFTTKPKRAKFAEGWPKTVEENLKRLEEAGFVIDRGVTKCYNCGELGHGSKQCPEEKVEKAKTVISCANCDGEGHRARDCTEPRKTPGVKACKNCGSVEHLAKECDQPRSAENVECRACGEQGHFSRDCPSKVLKCRNCDEIGHVSKECDKPKDWSRVQCSTCSEFGHTSKRCKKTVEDNNDDGDGGWGAGDGGAAVTSGDGGW